ncbi:MAG: ABC transporter permease [bacterium]|nr:ABC transporter permease [bacterium]
MTAVFDLFDATLLNATFRFVTPILLAALGGLLCERVGVFNIALEGLMLTGAFGAVIGSFYSGNAFLGVTIAMLAGAVMALIFGLFAIQMRGDTIVLGIAINLLASGTTVFLLRTLFNVKGAFRDPTLQGLTNIQIPGVESIPVLGAILSGHSWIIYCSWLLVPVTQLFLFHHPLGLRMRGVGEHPEAAETLGVKVANIRYLAVIVSGMLCGLAGAQLSLGNVTLFVEDMSAGRGWIAVVAVLFGRAHPIGVLLASLLFGLADSMGFRLQGLGMPSQFTGMLPYVVTLFSLLIFESRRHNAFF